MSATITFPKDSGIAIRPVENFTTIDGQRQSFGESYLVTVPARLTGGSRLRKQFPTLAEAKDFAGEQFNGTKKLGEEFFTLSQEDRRDAVSALALLPDTKPKLRLPKLVAEMLEAMKALPDGVTLLEAVKFAGPRLKPAGGDKTVAAVVDEMLVSKEKRQDNGQLRYCSVRDFRGRSAYLKKHFDGRAIGTLTAKEIKEWLVGLELSPRSTKNFLNTTAEIIRYAMQRKYVMSDPIADLTDDDRKELCGNDDDYREPTIVSPQEAERLLGAALAETKLEMLAYTTLALFCGIRSEELQKLTWENIKDGSYVEIPRTVAKKRRVRHVDIPAVAKPWLELCERKSGPIVDCSYAAFGRRFTALRTRAGFTKWDRNAMRHSFGSYHYALHGNALETARQMGHSQGDDTLFTHYRALASKDSAQKYFSIKPPTPASNVTRLISIA